ncbi:hypothetical protein KJ966_29380 [bacterium]|nr:hypothetical protein [bacterium]
MLKDEQLTLLDKLRFGDTAAERSQALKDLMLIEVEGKFEKDDLLILLEENDSVTQSYAIGAIGRLKTNEAIPRLKQLFMNSNDPLILPTLLETFAKLGSNQFVEIVVKRLREFAAKSSHDNSTNDPFLLDQVAIPSLKYFQVAGEKNIKDAIGCFLSDSNPTLRWHTLVTFDKLGIDISDGELITIEEQDKYALVREQAAIMLEKRTRK